jgi:D-alanine-D-alanine ligase-like ATP-grasp enzyme
VQHIFEQCGVPYTGSVVAASSLAMNKLVSKEIFKRCILWKLFHSQEDSLIIR